jgi:hypothetical protein
MNHVDGFERTNHDLEVGNLDIRAPGDHVHAINGDSVCHCGELQKCELCIFDNDSWKILQLLENNASIKWVNG